jgi:hypothetical protein
MKHNSQTPLKVIKQRWGGAAHQTVKPEKLSPLSLLRWQETVGDANSKTPLVANCESLALSETDHDELKLERALADETINESGVRINCRTKYGYVVLGKKKTSPPELLDSGDCSDLDDHEFFWDRKESGRCNPNLIPYFDLDAILVSLRPLKGLPRGQTPRLYLAGGRDARRRCKRLVITDAEFKALALHSVLGSIWATSAIPGIAMAKNLDVWEDILAWLQKLGAEEVLFAFDNKDYNRPRLEDRFEAEASARVGARRLENQGKRARVAHLPDQCRDENGKADWDSLLAALLKAGKDCESSRSLSIC